MVVTCDRLTDAENEQRLESCGKLDDSTEGNTTAASWHVLMWGWYGFLISPRHVLLTSHSLFDIPSLKYRNTNQSASTSDCKNGVVEAPQSRVDQFQVSKEMCHSDGKCEWIDFRAKRVFFLGYCDEPQGVFGLVLLEFESDLPVVGTASPICVPDPTLTIPIGAEVEAYNFVSEKVLKSTKPVEACTEKQHHGLDICFKNWEECDAIFYEGYAWNVDGRWTAVATVDHFICVQGVLPYVSITALANKICDVSGVCPKNPPPSVAESTPTVTAEPVQSQTEEPVQSQTEEAVESETEERQEDQAEETETTQKPEKQLNKTTKQLMDQKPEPVKKQKPEQLKEEDVEGSGETESPATSGAHQNEHFHLIALLVLISILV